MVCFIYQYLDELDLFTSKINIGIIKSLSGLSDVLIELVERCYPWFDVRNGEIFVCNINQGIYFFGYTNVIIFRHLDIKMNLYEIYMFVICM